MERSERRSPGDIDVVTFFLLPRDQTEDDLLEYYPQLRDRQVIKRTYGVDAYYVDLSLEGPETLISSAVYWYGLWSHTRQRLWKGFLQLTLSPEIDEDARKVLEKIAIEETGYERS